MKESVTVVYGYFETPKPGLLAFLAKLGFKYRGEQEDFELYLHKMPADIQHTAAILEDHFFCITDVNDYGIQLYFVQCRQDQRTKQGTKFDFDGDGYFFIPHRNIAAYGTRTPSGWPKKFKEQL